MNWNLLNNFNIKLDHIKENKYYIELFHLGETDVVEGVVKAKSQLPEVHTSSTFT